MHFLIVLGLLAFSAYGEELRISTGVSSHAQTPLEAQNDFIYYKIYPEFEPTPKPLDRCVLVHGYGITQRVIDELFHKRNNRILLGLGLLEPIDAFMQLYYGQYLLKKLRESVCHDVVVLVQETTQTSVLELIQRTEYFVTRACADRSCGLFGHSKGATTATAIAVRCMEKSTQMSRQACLNLRQVYSSGAGILGVAGNFTVKRILGYGLEELEPFLKQMKIPFVSSFEDLREFGLDLLQGYEPNVSNPIWIDLSPIAPMENHIPLGYRFNQILDQKGWFQGKYSAIAGGIRFGDDKKIPDSCGRRFNPSLESGIAVRRILGVMDIHVYDDVPIEPPLTSKLQDKICQVFGEAMQFLHADSLKPEFLTGQEEFAQMFPQHRKLIQHFTWDMLQISDGLVEFHTALDFCRMGLGKSRAIQSCRGFALNHMALSGGAMEVVDDVVFLWGGRPAKFGTRR